MAEQTIEEKLAILKGGALKNLEKKYGKESYFLGDKKIPQVPLLCSSGSLDLDNALCIGGFPRGRVIEMGGQESSGKSTVTLLNIAEIQKNGELCAYIDVEQSFDPHYAQRLGVDVNSLVIFQPETMEDTFEILFELLNSKVLSYIVVDSTNAMIPRKMLEGDTDTAMMGKSALLMSQQLPKVVSLASSTDCTVMFISQIRSKVGVVYGSPEKIGVGEAMKFYASQRLKVSKADVEKSDDEGQSSVTIKITILKNKVGVPFKKAQFTLLTGLDGRFGIDSTKELIDFAVKFDFIKKAGSWYSYGDDRLGQGINNVRVFFEENPEIMKDIKQKVTTLLDEKRKAERSIVDNLDSFDSKIEEIKESKKSKSKKEVKFDVDAKEVEETIIDAEVVEESNAPRRESIEITD